MISLCSFVDLGLIRASTISSPGELTGQFISGRLEHDVRDPFTPFAPKTLDCVAL